MPYGDCAGALEVYYAFAPPDCAAITEPVTVLQVAILKFIRDRDITFIEDILW